MGTKCIQLATGLTLCSLFATAPVEAESGWQEYATVSNRVLSIRETHPLGASLSDLHLRSRGFENELDEVVKDCDPLEQVFVTDLDNNGYDEFYLITRSVGSGSYGNVIGYASNHDKSLSPIYLPPAAPPGYPFTGYMGHDQFSVHNGVLLRTFGLYREGDSNAYPTGGRRTISYELVPGEAGWILQISDVD